MKNTEKLNAIRAKCRELLKIWEGKKDHNPIATAACAGAAEAGWRTTIAAIDQIFRHDGADGFNAIAIIAEWEGLL